MSLIVNGTTIEKLMVNGSEVKVLKVKSGSGEYVTVFEETSGTTKTWYFSTEDTVQNMFEISPGVYRTAIAATCSGEYELNALQEVFQNNDTVVFCLWSFCPDIDANSTNSVLENILHSDDSTNIFTIKYGDYYKQSYFDPIIGAGTYYEWKAIYDYPLPYYLNNSFIDISGKTLYITSAMANNEYLLKNNEQVYTHVSGDLVLYNSGLGAKEIVVAGGEIYKYWAGYSSHHPYYWNETLQGPMQVWNSSQARISSFFDAPLTYDAGYIWIMPITIAESDTSIYTQLESFFTNDEIIKPLWAKDFARSIKYIGQGMSWINEDGSAASGSYEGLKLFIPIIGDENGTFSSYVQGALSSGGFNVSILEESPEDNEISDIFENWLTTGGGDILIMHLPYNVSTLSMCSAMAESNSLQQVYFITDDYEHPAVLSMIYRNDGQQYQILDNGSQPIITYPDYFIDSPYSKNGVGMLVNTPIGLDAALSLASDDLGKSQIDTSKKIHMVMPLLQIGNINYYPNAEMPTVKTNYPILFDETLSIDDAKNLVSDVSLEVPASLLIQR